MERVIIFDSTLRDAEQTPGASLTVWEKLEIARQLAKLKVDVIEAGFPVSSNKDFEAVRRISHEIEGPTICALARAKPEDIYRAGEALAGAPKPRLHTFIGTSVSHRAMMKKSPDQVLVMTTAAVGLAQSLCPEVEFSPMDATRTEFEYLYEVIELAIKAGATIINIPDTVGWAVPEEFGALILEIQKRVPNINQAVISVHCHDDLGKAVANTLAGLKNGARQAECTINGLGERAGNAALEEIVMDLVVRQDYYGLYTNVWIQQICPTSHLVSRLMGIVVQPNKAIVGANAFAHSSGIHQDGVLKERKTFEIVNPDDVGAGASQIVLTARSGRHALRHRLEELGYHLSPDDLNEFYEKKFLPLADKKKEVYDEDLMAMMGDEMRDVPETYCLEYLHTSGGTNAIPTATVRIRIGAETKQWAECGDGPVDATFRAIQAVVNLPAKLTQYVVRAVTPGAEALGEVTVRLEEDGKVVIGRGASTDIIEASARAYIDGLNKLAARKKASG